MSNLRLHPRFFPGAIGQAGGSAPVAAVCFTHSGVVRGGSRPGMRQHLAKKESRIAPVAGVQHLDFAGNVLGMESLP